MTSANSISAAGAKKVAVTRRPRRGRCERACARTCFRLIGNAVIEPFRPAAMPAASA